MIATMAYFEVQSPKRTAKIRLDASFFVIGRGERIPIFHDDPSISREHAAVVVQKTGGVRVRDLGSKNGVLLNGKAIGRYAEASVGYGDTLKVGATVLVLREGEPPARTGEKPKSEPRAPEPALAAAEKAPGAEKALAAEKAPEVPKTPAVNATVPLDELATGLAQEGEPLGVLRGPPPVAAPAKSEPEAANDVEDLSAVADGERGENPPEILSSDDDEAELE